FAGLSWFAEGDRALLSEFDANKRWYQTALVDVADRKVAPKTLWSLSLDERYANPGSPVFESLGNGYFALRETDGALFLAGAGASPQGDRPFLDRYELATGKTVRLFRSEADAYERFVDFIGD